MEKAPEGALFVADSEKRGVPPEEFNTLAYLTYSFSTQHASNPSNKFLSVEVRRLRMWISARLETGLTPENDAMIAPFYTEPQDVWPASWRCFKESMEELALESAKLHSALGLSCGSSGAELDKRDAEANAWRIRMGYAAE